MYKSEAKIILKKLDYIMNAITNERSDLAEPVVLELIDFAKERNGLVDH
jgi:hypothetical protein